MYPIYPLLALMAAYALDGMLEGSVVIFNAIHTYTGTSRSSHSHMMLRNVIRIGVVVLCVLTGTARVAASRRNFGGEGVCLATTCLVCVYEGEGVYV